MGGFGGSFGGYFCHPGVRGGGRVFGGGSFMGRLCELFGRDFGGMDFWPGLVVAAIGGHSRVGFSFWEGGVVIVIVAEKLQCRRTPVVED